jgi:predicted MPP superfamily phosphohydrolase
MKVKGNMPNHPHQTMKTITHPSPVRALWLSDTHLDRAPARELNRLLERIARTESDCMVVTGDISQAGELHDHLRLLATACAPRPLYFVTGNHDYHGSSIGEVESLLRDLCETVDNLHHVDGRRIIPLGRNVCLIGHRGWPDARAGCGQRAVIDFPDRHVIGDFDGLSLSQSLSKMTELGRESARVIRRTLPLALSRYRHVVVLTHVPPFPSAACYNNEPCGPTHSPHFVNVSAGLAIGGIAGAFPNRHITVLAGHAHCSCMVRVRPNVCVRVAYARTGKPGPFEMLEF